MTNNTNIFLRSGTSHCGPTMTETGQCGLMEQAETALVVVEGIEEVPAVTIVCCNLNT